MKYPMIDKGTEFPERKLEITKIWTEITPVDINVEDGKIITFFCEIIHFEKNEEKDEKDSNKI